MNRIKNIYILLLILLITGCNDDFLEVAPLDRFSDSAVWSDPALITAYVDNIYMGQHHAFQTEMMSSLSDESMDVWDWEAKPILNSEISDSYLGVLSPWHWTGDYYNLTWNSLYKNIRACNLFFENIEKSGLEGDDIDKLKGEVHFLRGYFYGWLMSFYGGVPIIDKAYTPTDEFLVPRNTLEETVNFIVADCDAAAAMLPASGDKARATKGAALTLKSKILLYAASDLFASASWTNGYGNPELISYTSGSQMDRWKAAKDAAKAVINLGVYSLYGGTSFDSQEAATQNYINIFLNNGNEEDIFLSFFDHANNANNWDNPNVGLFNGPNGWENWGGNTPIGQLVDDYEMADGTYFDWSNPDQAAAPYENRDPRFYANILYDGAYWKPRPESTAGTDPTGRVQTGSYVQADGTTIPGLDTRQGPVQDWNGTYTGYYLRKFIDPAVNHTATNMQKYPWRQMRYAEVLLNYAEACIELGEEGEAKTYLNMIRNRAGMPDVPVSETGVDLMERYRNERRIELSYEQHRYFDIRRWMIAPDVITPAEGIKIVYPYGSSTPTYSVLDNVQGRAWNDNKSYFLPILLDELNRNNELIQNPGY
ncbi:RagB/SusD family nutrient uptake outer membrane protein [Aestuariibaculum lutulentum]|uniref:RagB/SusD family nutrient uptake outer membrane protein n=1 Tax=Aestuariibaculum lutulentum TaxID=2920935 RepID=A0ABS9RJF8_9FLAO|nr:RagB/SusD family nutrient uptake outer membrane protein [Aestuariibaculum lutulentum]MCH4553085.1 RagB/SusD family nutrient uptake outer membrane protein [Aestuariibaculum lutulentum]